MLRRKIIWRHLLIRRFEAGDLLETFLVSAVASLLLIRFLLKVTGYPQLGGDYLHIAHLLWGGILMLVAIIILLVSISRLPVHLAAVIGGAGFGAFIDELGKFITRDHDYFYEPTIALIYVFFILLFLVFRALSRYAPEGEQANLVNALELTKEAVIRDLDEEERQSALKFLSRCNPDDPVVRALRDLLNAAESVSPALPRPAERIRVFLRRHRRRFFASAWFRHGINLAVLACLAGVMAEGPERVPSLWHPSATAAWGQLFSSALIAALVAFGLFRLRRSRAAAFRQFSRAALVSIFVTQVFAFYRTQLKAVTGLAVSIALWLVLRSALHEEEMARAAEPTAGRGADSGPRRDGGEGGAGKGKTESPAD